MKAYTAAGGAATPFSFQLTFCPEFLVWSNTVALTSIKVEDQGYGTVLDLDSTGIPAVGNLMFIGTVASNLMLVLADGVLLNRNITISGVTSAAGAIDFYVSGDKKGTAFMKTTKAAILANNPTVFSKFTALFVPSMAAGDRAIVDYVSGHSQIYEVAELKQLSGHFQNVTGAIINNVQSYIKQVTMLCASQNTAYILSVVV